MLVFKMFLFSLLIAFLVAKLEIEVEGKHGWAENLPTWRIKNRWTDIILGNYLTGYHVWLTLTIIVSLHFPFVFGIPWSLSLEFMLFALFWIAVLAEDLFWFIFNPAYGLRKLNKTNAYWHKDWIGFIPAYYVRLAFIIIIFFLLSLVLTTHS